MGSKVLQEWFATIEKTPTLKNRFKVSKEFTHLNSKLEQWDKTPNSLSAKGAAYDAMNQWLKSKNPQSLSERKTMKDLASPNC
jgi:hypothetical protein